VGTPTISADALEDVYSKVVPSGTHSLFRGYAANRSTDVRAGLTGVVDAITAAPDFGAVTERWFPWTQRYQRDEWLELLLSYSEYAALEPNLRHRLLDAVATTIDDHGGSFLMDFETVFDNGEAARLTATPWRRSRVPSVPTAAHGFRDGYLAVRYVPPPRR